MKRAGIMIVVGIMAMCLAFNAGAAEKVTVYTSLETDETVKYLEAARRDMPDLEINIIRLSTGSWVRACWPKRTIRRRIWSGAGRLPAWRNLSPRGCSSRTNPKV